MPRTNTEAESKEQWSPESAYRSLPTSPYAPSQGSSLSKVDHAIPPTIDNTDLYADCIKCSNKFSPYNLISLSCKHSLCHHCFGVSITACLETFDCFPASHCKITIALKVIARNVSRELFARYRKRQYDMDLGKALRSGVSQARVPTNSQSLLAPAHSRSGSRQEAQVNQISGTSDDRKDDADENKCGAPLTRQGTSGLRTQVHVDSSNTPPPTPRPKPKKLLISTKAVAPPKAQIDAASKEWANMTPGAALEYAKNLALQQQIPFYSILDQRRAIGAHIDRKDQEANLKWQLRRFFSNPTGSSTATSSAAVSKLFDKYRGMMVSFKSCYKKY